jgi:RHS repeat-associated protein
LITNNTGVVTDAYNYDGYGNLLQSVGDANEERYRGETSDSSTGLQYLRARYYDPSTGRFLSTDAFEGVLESPVSRHRYLYGNDNPITYADPSGNFSIAEAVSAITINDVLIGLGVVSYAATLAILNNNRSIEWDGELQYSFSASSEVISAGLAGAVVAGLGGLFLNAKSEERDFKGLGIGRYENTWFIATASIDLEITTLKSLVKFDVKPKKLDKLVSPAMFGANMWTFFGEVATGQFQVPENSKLSSGAGFLIGAGIGWYTKDATTAEVDLSLKVGFSVPTGKGEIK